MRPHEKEWLNELYHPFNEKLNSCLKEEEVACILVIFKMYWQMKEENAKDTYFVQRKKTKYTCIFSFVQKATGKVNQTPMRLVPMGEDGQRLEE